MAFAFIAGTVAGSSDGNAVTTSNIDTSGANLIVLAVGGVEDPGPINTPTDSKSNSWVPLTKYNEGTQSKSIQFFYAVNPSVGSGHTFSESSSGLQPSIAVGAFSGSHSSPFDTENGGADSSNPWTPGAITPALANSLVVSAIVVRDDTNSLTVDSSLTIAGQVLSTANHVQIGLGYLLDAAASSINPGWDNGSGGQFTAVTVASFKPAAAEAGAVVPRINWNYMRITR